MVRSVGIVWFRRDLRLADHPALTEAAAEHDELVALFVHDARLAAPSGPNRLAFLRGCLDLLDHDLGGRLVERAGDPAAVVAGLAAEVDATAVYVTEDFGPYGRDRDEAVDAALASDGRELVRVGTPYAVAPDTVFTKAGTPFQVFTPYSRAWRAHGWDEPLPRPGGLHWIDGVSSELSAPDVAKASADPDGLPLPEPGEAAAHRALAAFLADPVVAYATDRDRPDLDRTSRLSAHLKFGTLHPRQVLAALAKGSGPDTFASELCWRDFYADVLYRRPDSAHRNYTPGMDGLRWDAGTVADERFEAWSTGRTGYPIVDAGMRQLLAEGWMHNRVRMIVASFLVKDLHIDWRRGAAWFMHHLVDGDLASNSHGWQWTSGTGTDAAPFFRIFNPTTQGQRFDPRGDYVRRYVPELRHLAGKAVHEPWKLEPAGLFDEGDHGSYPAPIVDHAVERDEALERYRAR